MTEQITIETAQNPAARVTRFLSPAGKFFLVLCGYFGIQIVLRLITSNTTDLDESQQLVLTQQFQWGYGPQPPLYTWLQMLVFKIFTPSILGLTVLKNLLLLGTYCFTYLNARLVTGSHSLGAATAATLFFIPQIAWESQRDLTHTVLATTLAAGTFHFFLRLRGERSLVNYFLFGLLCGLGLLSKYNYAAFLFGLIVAALTLSSFRKIILNPKIFLALTICALVVLPHAIWAFQNPSDVTSSAHKFRVQSEAVWYTVLFTGPKNLILAAATHAGSLVAILGLISLVSQRPSPADTSDREPAKLILRGVFAVLATLACGVMVFKVTAFRERWFQPVFVCLPVALIFFWQYRLGKRQLYAIAALACAVMLAVSIAMPTRVWLAEELHRSELLSAPFDRFAADIRAASRKINCFVAEDSWVGGNFRLQFPQTTVLTPQLPKTWRSEPAGKDCLVVWGATQKKKPKALNGLNDVAEFDAAAADYYDELLKFHGEEQTRLWITPGKIRSATERH